MGEHEELNEKLNEIPQSPVQPTHFNRVINGPLIKVYLSNVYQVILPEQKWC